MNSVLTENLYAAFPYLYRGHNKPPSESSMYRGFECEDGWYSVLYDLSQELTDYLAQHPDVEIEVMQVKQKLGSLRYLAKGVDAATGKMIERACQRALLTCELTGMAGQLCHIAKVKNRGLLYEGPYMILCPEKAKELGYTPIFTGPSDLAEFAAICSKALLEKAQHTLKFPEGSSEKAWPVEEIRKQNATLLSKLTHQGNVYALFVREKKEHAEWKVMYVGQREADGLRSRITQHFIKKDHQTSSKLKEIQASVANGLEIGLSFILVEPQSLRLFVEETIIGKNKLPWNSQGSVKRGRAKARGSTLCIIYKSEQL